jgi:hypothetical protein
MILPDKHVRLSSSFLGAGAALLELLGSRRTVSSLWTAARRQEEIHTFERFTLTLDMLYALGLVEFGRDGLLTRTGR